MCALGSTHTELTELLNLQTVSSQREESSGSTRMSEGALRCCVSATLLAVKTRTWYEGMALWWLDEADPLPFIEVPISDASMHKVRAGHELGISER